nr:unnamed protein product [uncultured bacterium]
MSKCAAALLLRLGAIEVKYRRISAAVLAVLSSVMLIVASVAPAFAADQTISLQIPSDWTGPSAGTNQTGTPYSWFYLIDCDYRSQGNQYPPEHYDYASYVNSAYIAVNPSYNGQTDFNLSAALLEPITVKAGYTYTVSIRMAIDARNADWETTAGVAFVTLSLGGNVVMRKGFSTNSFFTLESEVLVASDDLINDVEISLEFTEAVSGVWIRLGWLKCLIRDSTGDIITEIQSGTQQIIGNQNSGTQQIIDNQNQNTQDILSGDGLTGANPIDDSELQGSMGEEDAVMGEIDSLIDDSALDDFEMPSFDQNLSGAFIQINNLFSRLVSTLDISIVLVFCLTLGLALYVIGRRVS